MNKWHYISKGYIITDCSAHYSHVCKKLNDHNAKTLKHKITLLELIACELRKTSTIEILQEIDCVATNHNNYCSKSCTQIFLLTKDMGCLPFDRKIRLGCRKHNGKRFASLPWKCHIRYGLNPKKGRICVAWVSNREGTKKLVNGKQHSIWFVPTGMKGLPQNVPLNFRLEFHPEFPKFSVKW